MTVWFTSDLHFGHRFVAELRQEISVQNHDANICLTWESQVKPDDVVWVLGDLAVSSPMPALRAIKSLPGRKRLILGNHDKAHPMYRDAWKWQREYLDAFEYVAPFSRVKVCGVEAMLSHFPYHRDRGPSRYLEYRLRDEGMPLIHGHLHSLDTWSITGSGSVEVHVGWDAWKRLVPDYEVRDLLIP